MKSFIVEPLSRPLAGRMEVPGDKSIGHRSLLFGALCDGEVEVSGLSGGQDNSRTRVAMESMGVRVTDRGPGRVHIAGVGLDGLTAARGAIDCGNSGTSMRLLCGLLGGQRFDSRLIGDESLTGRPMRRVTEPLLSMGAVIDGVSRASRPGEVYPPLVVRGVSAPLRGIDVELAVASAQVKSAILLAGLYAEEPVRVREPGPSRDHTERMLASLGAPIAVSGDGSVTLDPIGWERRLSGGAFEVPGDPSSAAFLVAAGLVAGATRLEIARVGLNRTRTGFLDALDEMGAGVRRSPAAPAGPGEPIGDLVVEAPSGGAGLRATSVGGSLVVRAIDEIPILAVLAARADGTTSIGDAAELRVKESDRLATTSAMLRAFGVEVEEMPDGLVIRGQPGARLRAAHIDSAGDHRIAMSATIAALVADGPSRIEDTGNVATSFPGFAGALNQLAGGVVVTEVG